MKIGVMGYTGFIGRSIAWRLIAIGHEVVGLTRGDAGREDLEVVINCAGSTRGTPEEIEYSNSKFPVDVIDAYPMAKHIWISSAQVYGMQDVTLESMLSPFAKAKLAGERALSGRAVIVRPTNVYGPDARPDHNNVIATWLSRISSSRAIDCAAGCRRDFVDVMSLARVVGTIVDGDLSPSIVDVRSGFLSSIEDVANALVAAGAEVRYVSAPPSTPSQDAAWVESGSTVVTGDVVLEDVWRLLDSHRFAGLVEKREPRAFLDARGSLLEVEADHGSQARVYVFSAREGVTRGGHYHKKQTEWFTAVTPVEVMLSLSSAEHKFTLRPGCSFRADPMVKHSFWNPSRSEAIVVASSDAPYEKGQSPDTYR